MSEMKTFSGKNVDEAMEQACRFFKTEREKLEIEIVPGGPTGIFGLVGQKKAEIRDRMREEIRPLAQPAVPVCPTRHCNTQSTRRLLHCQDTSDFVRLQQCQISCDKIFSLCPDAAYKAISAAEEQNNLQATAITATTTTR